MKVSRPHTTPSHFTTPRHHLSLAPQRIPAHSTPRVSHTTARPVVDRRVFHKLETAFLNVRGPLALTTLEACRRDVRVIAIGGDQLTGKSTLCQDILIHLDEHHYNVATEQGKVPNNVTFLSAGKVFRQLAAEQGVPVGTFSKMAKSDPSIDVSIEYETCKGIMGGIHYTGRNVSSMITLDSQYRHLLTSEQVQYIKQRDGSNTHRTDAGGDSSSSGEEYGLDEVNDSVLTSTSPQKSPKRSKPSSRYTFTPPQDTEHTIIIEGRNPAVMAAYCHSVFNKENIFTIYLSCNPRVQSRRYIGREIGRELSVELDRHLPDRPYRDLADVGGEISKLLADPEHLPEDLKRLVPNVQAVVDSFVANQARDEDDKQRYLAAYEFPQDMSYSSPTLYNTVIDTSFHLPQDTLREVLNVLPPTFIHDLPEYYQTRPM